MRRAPAAHTVSPRSRDTSWCRRGYDTAARSPARMRRPLWVATLLLILLAPAASALGNAEWYVADANAIDVSTSWEATCVLTTRSRAVCETLALETISFEPSDVVEVDAGHTYACILRSNSGVQCDGLNDFGQTNPPSVCCWNVLDVGPDTACATARGSSSLTCWGRIATLVAGTYPGAGILDVSVGYGHACAVLLDSQVVCKGLSGTPQRGSAITSGEDFACVIGLDAGLRCWGPNAPAGLPQGPVSKIAAGRDHVCALRPSGNIQCSSTFWAVQALAYDGGDAIALSAGNYQTCFVVRSGEAQCRALWLGASPPYVALEATVDVRDARLRVCDDWNGDGVCSDAEAGPANVQSRYEIEGPVDVWTGPDADGDGVPAAIGYRDGAWIVDVGDPALVSRRVDSVEDIALDDDGDPDHPASAGLGPRDAYVCGADTLCLDAGVDVHFLGEPVTPGPASVALGGPADAVEGASGWRPYALDADELTLHGFPTDSTTSVPGTGGSAGPQSLVWSGTSLRTSCGPATYSAGSVAASGFVELTVTSPSPTDPPIVANARCAALNALASDRSIPFDLLP